MSPTETTPSQQTHVQADLTSSRRVSCDSVIVARDTLDIRRRPHTTRVRQRERDKNGVNARSTPAT